MKRARSFKLGHLHEIFKAIFQAIAIQQPITEILVE